MSMIPDEVIEQVRDGADLVGLIGETVELRKTGSDYRGACPFHGGTHRNFAVIPRKGRYYCFVCKASGDVFSYFMKRFGMDYPTAVREVAQRSGIVIPETPGRSGPDPREPLFSALAAAQDWFTRQLHELPESAAARDYLKGRAFELDELAAFDLGYAPRTGALVAAMGELGIREPVLLEAGLLARRDDGTLVPRFRGRLVFPIHDGRGRVVGFGGRLLGPGEPKYLNSPDSPVFHKGGLLYNLHQAKTAIRKQESVILVEGYFDVVRLVLAGIEHVVAPLGTALTADHAGALRRLTAQATLLFDSDAAGLRATFRAGDELLGHGMRVRVATLPPGEDPDSLVRQGGTEAMTPILHDAVDVLERKLQILEARGWFNEVDRRREALDRLLPTLRATSDPITRELYLTLVAERSGVDKKVLEQEVAALPPRAGAAGPGAAAPRLGQRVPVDSKARPPSLQRDGARAEQQLLRLLLSSEPWLERARESVPVEWFEGTEYREVYAALLQHRTGDPAAPDALSPAARQVWADLLTQGAELGGQQLDQIFEGACQTLEARPLFRALEALAERIPQATPEAQAVLAEEKDHLIQELKERFPVAWQQRYGWRRLRVGGRKAPGGSRT
jgi:DNA primase